MSIRDRLDAAAELLASVREIVDQRVVEPEAPAWVRSRGWEDFLRSLSDDDIDHAEELGLPAAIDGFAEAPRSLVSLCHALREIAGTIVKPGAVVDGGALRCASQRKADQVAALVQICKPSRAVRVVDVGSGRGHLTRELARELGLPAIGYERDALRVKRARELTLDEKTTFHAKEVLGLNFAKGDLAVGLHACGSLGDELTRAAARDRVDLVLVNCCLQRFDQAQREPISARGLELGLHLSQPVMGLTNLVAGRRLVKGDLSTLKKSRQSKRGLRLLLQSRGLTIHPGDEMRRIHRRHLRKNFSDLAQQALSLRGLSPPTPEELDQAQGQAAEDFPWIRRWSLPRYMLGRLLELVVVLDRACLVEESGRIVSVQSAFSLDTSPRNLAIVALGPGKRSSRTVCQGHGFSRRTTAS